MCAKHYENPTMLSRVTAKNVGDVFFETHCISTPLCGWFKVESKGAKGESKGKGRAKPAENLTIFAVTVEL